jgi:hypothetical protein
MIYEYLVPAPVSYPVSQTNYKGERFSQISDDYFWMKTKDNKYKKKVGYPLNNELMCWSNPKSTTKYYLQKRMEMNKKRTRRGEMKNTILPHKSILLKMEKEIINL